MAEPDRLEKVKAILEDALELPLDERETFVRRACGNDEAVREEVESLLAHEDDRPPWAEGPLLLVPGLPEDESDGEGLGPGQRIGPYRVETVIGAGGMGTVVLAVREDDFAKKVALKVVHARVSEELIRRFQGERQIVAQLEHPQYRPPPRRRHRRRRPAVLRHGAGRWRAHRCLLRSHGAGNPGEDRAGAPDLLGA